MTATNHPDHPVLAPTQQVERIQIVDILRGFALFGILLVNMALFSRPFQSILFPADPSMPWYDRAAEWLIHTLAEGKFYAMFSLLFGLGMVLLMERIQARGGRFVPLYVRRLLALLLIGLVHAFLIWPGDILILYALVGFPLILFRKARPRTLLIWAVILIAIPLLLTAASTGMVALGRAVPEGAAQIDQAFAQTEARYLQDIARANRVYPDGNFLEITAQRVYDYGSMGLTSFFVLGFNVLAMFLIGAYFGKRRIFNDLAAHRPLFRKLLVVGLIVGLAGNALYATLIMPAARFEPTGSLALATVAQGIGAPLLSLAYISAICLLALRPAWQSPPAGAGARGTDGLDQLPAGVHHLHADLLRLRPRLLRQDGVSGRDSLDRRDLPAPDPLQPLVDETLPLRPRRVVVAVDDLPEAAADAEVSVTLTFDI